MSHLALPEKIRANPSPTDSESEPSEPEGEGSATERACPNCGEVLSSTPYCPHCGQDTANRVAPLKTLAHDVLEEFLKWDGRLFETLKALIFRPGRLTLEYNQGRRVRYLSPFKMYFVVSAVFFFLVSLNPFQGKLNATIRDEQPVTSIGGKQYAVGQLAAAYEAWNTNPRNPERGEKGFKFQFHRAVYRVMDAPGDYISNLVQALGKTLLILLPFYAGVLAILYVRQKRFFVEHLVFAAHNHTFLLLLCVVIDLAVQRLPPQALLLALIYPVYEFRALRQFYGQGIWHTALKQGILNLVFGLVLVTGVTLTVLVTMLLQ